MDFYSVDCKRETFKNGKWERDFGTEKIIVVAENEKDAINKINNGIDNFKSDTIRHVISGETRCCNGLLISNFIRDQDLTVPI